MPKADTKHRIPNQLSQSPCKAIDIFWREQDGILSMMQYITDIFHSRSDNSLTHRHIFKDLHRRSIRGSPWTDSDVHCSHKLAYHIIGLATRDGHLPRQGLRYEPAFKTSAGWSVSYN